MDLDEYYSVDVQREGNGLHANIALPKYMRTEAIDAAVVAFADVLRAETDRQYPGVEPIHTNVTYIAFSSTQDALVST